ncbi:GatB/YqeY domain-containing protein [Terriglobus aquaticus]|uniref:GatB/YqeY domain-containing protein n=1 Tax=Terriglobus aquaticus TaxID=940139 RepID=A0ABW9KN94_9BACT|nr:GatB/YqeY domain-containing protein [Terriglobus aquaticus]
MATISEQIGKDIVEAMKAKETLRLETLRMVKSAIKNKEIDKREPLTDAETVAVLNTLVKQRQDSAEQFAKGNRPELAQKEQDEIKLLQVYLPQSAGEDEIRAVVQGAVAHLAAGGTTPGPKDMGPAMRIVQQRILASGLHADNKTVSAILKEELAKSAA